MRCICGENECKTSDTVRSFWLNRNRSGDGGGTEAAHNQRRGECISITHAMIYAPWTNEGSVTLE